MEYNRNHWVSKYKLQILLEIGYIIVATYVILCQVALTCIHVVWGYRGFAPTGLGIQP